MRLASFLLLWLIFYGIARLLRPQRSYATIVRVPPTHDQRMRIYRRDGFRCRWCRASSNLQIDHIWPVCRGGRTVDSNLQTLCKRCNRMKGARV